MTRAHYYTLRGHKAVPQPDVLAWHVWSMGANVSVARTHLDDGTYVSTVFLGIDHGIGDVPILFETMIFGGPLHDTKYRTANWRTAELAHARAVELAKGAKIDAST
jgi:hypothetical protein